MTNRVHTTEIDIESDSIDVSTQHGRIYRLEIPFYKEVIVNVDREIRILKEIKVATEQVAATIAQPPINRVIENDPLFVGLAQGELTLSKGTKLEVILGDTYGKGIIQQYSSDSINKFASKTFEDDIAFGAAEFNQKFWTFDELSVRPFENDPIEEFENSKIGDVFANKNVQKNVSIDGTVSFVDPGFSGIRIRAFAGDEIDQYSNETFDDLSGLKTSVIGTNTQFTVDFLVNESIITNTEKFLVSLIANNEYLEVNVNPEENYIDASVYREYFV
jgi:hypothetical protein